MGKRSKIDEVGLIKLKAPSMYRSTPSGKFLTANSSFARLLGFLDPDELIQYIQNIDNQLYVRPVLRKKFMDILRTHSEGHGLEYEAYRKDGTKMWLRIHARAVRDKRGNVLCFEGIAEDASEIKSKDAYIDNLQAQLLAFENQLRQLRSKSEIALMFAHDISSPLTALKVSAFKIGDSRDSASLLFRRALLRIEDMVRSLSSELGLRKMPLIEGLSSSEAERRCSLADVISETVAEKQRLLHHGEGQIRFQTNGVSRGIAPENRLKLGRILSNLIDNAVEARKEGSKIDVELSLLVNENNETTLIIRDNGNGIPSEILPTLMQRGATFGKLGGSGLGLHQAKTWIDDWGGSIEIRSVEGVGTTITIFLPPLANGFIYELS